MTEMGFKVARAILSRTPEEARRRVLHLYRAWYRQLPYIVKEYGYTYMSATLPQLQQKLREEFIKNKDVKDIRIIDLLVHRVYLHFAYYVLGPNGFVGSCSHVAL